MEAKRKNERGQAVAELTIAMVAILAAVSGMLLIAQLGRTSVRNVLDAKAKCDINSMNGMRVSSGSSIRCWEIGDDNLEMTPDDEPMTFTNDDPLLFSSQLSSGGFRLASMPDYVQNNFAKNLSTGNLFFDSADLTSGMENVEIELDDATRFLYGGKTLFGIPSITIENKVYAPALSE